MSGSPRSSGVRLEPKDVQAIRDRIIGDIFLNGARKHVDDDPVQLAARQGLVRVEGKWRPR